MDAKALHRVKADIANNKSVCSNCWRVSLILCKPRLITVEASSPQTE